MNNDLKSSLRKSRMPNNEKQTQTEITGPVVADTQPKNDKRKLLKSQPTIYGFSYDSTKSPEKDEGPTPTGEH